MKVSVIIAIYKDIEALKLIIESLKNQTYKNFEVVIAEDNNCLNMKEYIDSIKDLNIIHTFQDDIGVRKSKSQNNGILASTGDYLIFIDGDCILYTDFIEKHVALSKEDTIVSGRRVNLGPKYSTMLRNNQINSSLLEKSFVKKYFDIANDAKKEKHTEEGFRIKPFGLIHRLMLRRKRELSLLGCNFSCYKKAMLDINGFDEDLGNSAYASDADLEWRFKGLGYKTLNGKYIANQFHLYHIRKENEYNRKQVKEIEENQKNKRYTCKNGLKKL